MKRQTIADRKHRFKVCRQADVVINGATIVLQRAELYAGWGSLEMSRGSFHGANGAVVEESRNSPGATIKMRYRSDIMINSAAWILEERLKSAPRWFKILSVVEDCELFVFKVRIVERADDLMPAVPPETPLPQETISPVAPPDWLKL